MHSREKLKGKLRGKSKGRLFEGEKFYGKSNDNKILLIQ